MARPSSTKRQHILMLALALAIVAMGIFWYLRASPNPQAFVERVGEDASAPQSRFVQLLASLSSLQLDTAFFQNQIFVRLADFGARVELPVERGRQNPFAPLR
jgi:hypothetical protein